MLRAASGNVMETHDIWDHSLVIVTVMCFFFSSRRRHTRFDCDWSSDVCSSDLGFDPEEGIPSDEVFYQRVHPEDRDRVRREVFHESPNEGSHFDVDFRIVLSGGAIKYVRSTGHRVRKVSGDLVEYVGTSIDVTERKWAEALRDGESRILEMIARDAPLEEILESLVRVVEAQFAGLLCSVLLLDEDGQHMRHGAAPSLPKPYIEAIDGHCIGPKAGSCGTAMYRRESVVVTDILRDPLWEAYRSVAEPYGFRACWSTPILAHSGKALGSFAMYYCEPRSPSPAQTRALEMATHLAGIAIERKLARERSEEHTSELQSQSNLVCRLLLEKKKKKPQEYSSQLIHQSVLVYLRSVI